MGSTMLSIRTGGSWLAGGNTAAAGSAQGGEPASRKDSKKLIPALPPALIFLRGSLVADISVNMNDTPNLALPYILAAQAQKHVTHNEAIRALDCLVQLAVESRTLTTPPSSPAEGARYIVAASPSGAWSGKAGKIAAFQDGAWTFYAPKEGWVAWIAADSALVIYAAGAWTLFAGSGGGGGGGLSAPVANSSLANMANATIKGRTSAGSGAPEDLSGAQATALLDAFVASGGSHKKGLVPDPGATAGTTKFLREDATWADLANVPLVGVNATADATNKLAVKSPASLFDNTGNGHQLKINKAAASDTASQLYQTNYSGRAEIGLTGDDDFHFKVSPDGSNWYEGIRIARSNGRVSFPSGGAREVLTANRTYYVRLSDGSDANDGLSNTSGGAFKTVQKALDTVYGTLDIQTYDVSVRMAAGTCTEAVAVRTRAIGSGRVFLIGDETTPGNCVLNGNDSITVTNGGQIYVRGFRIKPSGTNRNGLYVNAGYSTIFFRNCEFETTSGGYHIFCSQGLIQADGPYAIVSGGHAHVFAKVTGAVNIDARTITISNTPAWVTAFAVVQQSQFSAVSASYAGSATGNRFSVTMNGVIVTNGAGTSAFPGDAAGTTATGGQYT